MTQILEEIIDCKEHLAESYRLLRLRQHAISHASIPSFEEHSRFVSSKPYRHWFLIKNFDEYVGTVYVQDDNSIGLNLVAEHTFLAPGVLHNIKDFCEPLHAIPSKRNGRFFINIPSSDIELRDTLLARGGIEIQRSFLLP